MNISVQALCEKNTMSWLAFEEQQCVALRTNVCEDDYCHCTFKKGQLCYVNSDIGGKNNDNI